MANLVKVDLHLTKPQFHKLKRGKQVQLGHHQLGVKKHFLLVHPHTAKRIHHAMKHKKGVRVMLSQHEFDRTAEGGGFLDWLKGAWNTIKDVGSKIVNSDIYQTVAKPVVRGLVDTGLSLAPVSGTAKNLLTAGVNELGKASNAFGLKHHKKRGRKHQMLEHNPHKKDEELEKGMVYQEIFANPKATTPGQPGFIALPSAGASGMIQHVIHHHVSHAGSFRLA
jgi:hypothetical protein